MKNLLKLSAIAILAVSAASTFASNKEPYTEQGTNAREMTEQKPIHWISVEQLKKELEGKAPINVSFDMMILYFSVALVSTTAKKNTHQVKMIT